MTDEFATCMNCGDLTWLDNYNRERCAGCGDFVYDCQCDTPEPNGTPPTCSSCDSVIYPGEPQRSGDDGELLCGDCYGRLHGERDRADERYRLGDIQFDQSRGN